MENQFTNTIFWETEKDKDGFETAVNLARAKHGKDKVNVTKYVKALLKTRDEKKMDKELGD